MRKFFAYIGLHKLKCVLMDLTKNDGTKVPGVFIPFEANYITIDDEKRISWLVNIIVNDESDKWDQFGFIASKAMGVKWNELSKEEQKKINELPIVGNLREIVPQGEQSALKDTEPVEAPAPTNDLPF